MNQIRKSLLDRVDRLMDLKADQYGRDFVSLHEVIGLVEQRMSACYDCLNQGKADAAYNALSSIVVDLLLYVEQNDRSSVKEKN